MKSSLKNMVVVLFTITLISSAGVGYVNMITVEPIAAAKAAATEAALQAVLPPFDKTETSELTIDELPVAVHTADGRGIFMRDGVRYLVAREGDTYKTIARSLGISASRLKRYNRKHIEGKEVSAGDTVYLDRPAREKGARAGRRNSPEL